LAAYITMWHSTFQFSVNLLSVSEHKVYFELSSCSSQDEWRHTPLYTHKILISSFCRLGSLAPMHHVVHTDVRRYLPDSPTLLDIHQCCRRSTSKDLCVCLSARGRCGTLQYPACDRQIAVGRLAGHCGRLLIRVYAACDITVDVEDFHLDISRHASFSVGTANGWRRIEIGPRANASSMLYV